MAQAAVEKQKSNGKGQQMTTYTVQMQQAFAPHDDDGPLPGAPGVAWIDLGTFESHSPRGAVKLAMDRNEIDEGDFRAIPATSAKIHSPRVTRTVVWD